MINSCSVIIRKPLGSEAATLGVRAAWAMLGSAGMEVNIILMGDGLYSPLGREGYVKGLFERFLKEDGKIYAVQEDMEERNLEAALFPAGVSPLDADDLFGIIEDSDSVMTF